jgi:Acyl-CoA reductase (LuxC)
MVVRDLLHDSGAVELDAVLDGLLRAPAPAPFDPRAIDACDAIARALFRDPLARPHPELIALASWLRRSSTRRLAAEAYALTPPGVALAGRGLAFHLPPANVETMAMYSLAIALLCGNRNVIRISSRAGAVTERLLAALRSVLAAPEHADVRAGTALLAWGHEREPTERCSAACDVRVVWGGDATVAAVRAVPLPAAAKELVFADRHSLAAVDAAAWLAAGPDLRDELTRRLANDAYWFDQQACSSPRLIVWCGGERDAATASADLFDRLAQRLGERGYELPLGAVTGKLAWLAGAAIDRPIVRACSHGNALTVATLATLERLDRSHPGAGTFLEAVVPDLAALAPHVDRRDQTLVAFGFQEPALRRFAAAVAGRGIDRIVPFGAALAFSHHWDGMNLLLELSRHVSVQADAPASPLEAAA